MWVLKLATLPPSSFSHFLFVPLLLPTVTLLGPDECTKLLKRNLYSPILFGRILSRISRHGVPHSILPDRHFFYWRLTQGLNPFGFFIVLINF